MPSKMFAYVPLDGNKAGKTVRDEALAIAALYQKAEQKRIAKENRNPDDDTGKDAADSSDEEGGGGYGRYGRGGGNGPEPPRYLKDYHAQNGFHDVLAWSQGRGRRGRWGGRGRSTDISMTCWFETSTPSSIVACMRGEYIPNAAIRIFHGAQGSKFKVIEHNFDQCLISSVSLGGSGGEDRFTINISVSANKMTTRNYVIDVATGDIVSESTGTYNESNKEGSRTGVVEVPSLSSYCERYVLDNKTSFDKKELINLIRLGVCTLNPSDLDVDKSLLTMPRLGRRFLAFVFGGDRAMEPKEIFLKTLTATSLKTACLHATETQEEDLDYISVGTRSGRTVEITNDEQVEFLAADSEVYINLKEKEEKKDEAK